MGDARRDLVESTCLRLQRSGRPLAAINREVVWSLCEGLIAALDERDRLCAALAELRELGGYRDRDRTSRDLDLLPPWADQIISDALAPQEPLR